MVSEDRPPASESGPARQAVKEAAGALFHWSSAVSAVAVVIVAHWLALGGANSGAGLVFGASFAVFALLLPAVQLVRQHVDERRIPRLREVLRSDTISAQTLKTQREMFGELAGTLASLRRGIVLAVLAAIASSVAIIAPSVTVWGHAPGFLVFSLADFLTALALVCLIGTVAALFPFTWYLLRPDAGLHRLEQALSKKQDQLAKRVQPVHPTGDRPGASANADGTGTEAAPGVAEPARGSSESHSDARAAGDTSLAAGGSAVEDDERRLSDVRSGPPASGIQSRREER
jgi:hypothetical protein